MLETIKRLGLGLILIAVAAGVLLYTDRGSRNRTRRAPSASGPAAKVFRVAMVQHASLPVFEQGNQGLLEALAARGYADGGRIQLRRFNAEADIGTANAIAREVTTGDYDLIISLSTISLQTIANANKVGSRTLHVFGLVTDPFHAGVGIAPTNGAIHPPWLAGYGSLAPVETTFRIARQMRPELKSVGLVWNPAEANSLAQTKIARKVCADLGITLVEANAENSTSAQEAVNSLITRGVEAIWISGDVTVSLATDLIVSAARRAQIPVFTSMPPAVSRGTLFDLGADFVDVGQQVGQLAADVLDGKNPAEIPVKNVVPEVFLFNETVLATLKDRWTIPEPLRKRANGWITATETNLPVSTESRLQRKSPPATEERKQLAEHPPLARKAKIDLIEYLETPNVEINREGILAGFEKAGLKRGRDYELRVRNAQGDMASLNTIVDASVAEGSDILLTAATPALQAALRRAKGRTVVFSLVANPMLAGAGKSETDHLPFVTGAYIPAPHAEGLKALRQCMPHVKRVGTLFVPAEVNSVYYKEELTKAATQMGIEVEAVGVSSSGEVADAALALCGRNVDAICQISDNLTGGSFASIAQAAKRARLPLMGFASGQSKNGAFMTVSRDFFDGGVASAELVARVLRGESPGSIPFQLFEELKYVFNPAAAESCGVDIPPDLLRRGETVN